MSMYGIENLKKAFTFMFTVARSVETQLADGFQPLTDLPAIAYNMLGLVEIIKVRKDIGKELGNVDPVERDQLLVWVKETFDLAHEKAEKLVEDLFKLLDSIFDVVDDVKDLKKA